jgi:hypothetical protein
MNIDARMPYIVLLDLSSRLPLSPIHKERSSAADSGIIPNARAAPRRHAVRNAFYYNELRVEQNGGSGGVPARRFARALGEPPDSGDYFPIGAAERPFLRLFP